MNTASTNIVAGAAIVSPVWMPYLQHMSDLAALLLPIAGLVWLLVQIIGYFYKRKDK